MISIFIAFVFAAFVGFAVTLLAIGILIWFGAIFKEAFDILTGKGSPNQAIE